jgi:hypothetical protein
MASNAVLRWLDGRGWLVLSGGAENSDEIRGLALGRAAADGGVAYISVGGAHGSAAEWVLTDMEDLGAPTGYLVDVASEDDLTVQKKLAEAGVVVITGGADLVDLRSGLMGAAVSGIQEAFENGAVVLAEGLGAAMFGAWVLMKNGEATSGLDWLQNALVLPGVTSVAEAQQAKTLLNIYPTALAVGVGSGSALALGPDGEVETWGFKQVTIALGRDYSAPTTTER